MIIRNLFATCILLHVLISAASGAYQIGSTIGTTANTLVGGLTATADYFNGDRTVTKSVSSSTADVTVAPIYGYDVVFLTPSFNSSEPGLLVTYNYTLRNVGNSAQDFTLVTQNFYQSGDFTLVAPAQLQSALPIGATASFVITINVLATATPDAKVTLDASLQAVGHTTKPAYYTGYNDNIYGGYVSHNQQLVTWIEYPILQVAKTYTIGHVWDAQTTPLPGATVTYNITYHNAGSGTANNVVFIDIVPTLNTDYKIGSTRNICTDVGVTVSFAFDPTDNFNSWGYSPVGTKVDPKVSRIRMSLSPLKPNVSGTLNYSVIIK